MHVINVTNAETIKHRILFTRHHDQLQIHQAFLFAQAGCFVNHNFWTGDALSFQFDRYVLWQKKQYSARTLVVQHEIRLEFAVNPTAGQRTAQDVG